MDGVIECRVWRAQLLTLVSLPLQSLAIDLLNPSATTTEKTHKLKRLVQSPNSYFMDVKCPGASSCFPRARGLELMRCGLRRMLQHHHRLLARPDRRPLRILLHCPLPAHRRKGTSHRGCVALIPVACQSGELTWCSS